MATLTCLISDLTQPSFKKTFQKRKTVHFLTVFKQHKNRLLGGSWICSPCRDVPRTFVGLLEKWIKHEKLAYPIIQIPIAMTEEGGSFFKDRLMWLGFLIAGGINLINGLHFLYPQVPGLGGFRYDLGLLFDTKPFSAIGSTPIAVYPYIVGMSFFIPVDLSFSIWFFYIFKKMTWVLGSMLGLSHLPGFPYMTEQSAGAWLGLALVAAWMSRKHLFRQLKTALRTGKREKNTPMSARSAVLGLLLGSIFLIGFCWTAGVALWVILAYFFLFFSIAFAIPRVRAEVGPPVHYITTRPTTISVTFLGSRKIGTSSLTLFSFFPSFNRAYRCHPIPHILEGFAISDRRNIENKKLLWAIITAVIIGTLSSAWAYYFQAYNFGASLYGEQAQCHWTLNETVAWAINPSSPNSTGISAILTAGAFTFVLMALRHHFLWWPLHPAGYAISLGYWGTNWHWFSIFISLVPKNDNLEIWGDSSS